MAPKYTDNGSQLRDAQGVFLVGGDGSSPASPSNPSSISGVPSAVVSGTVTRPADTTAYAIGDLIANSVTAGSVVPLSFALARAIDTPFLMRRVRIKANAAGWKGAIVRLHLFKDTPTVTVGDNGALNASETYAFTESLYLGYVDVTLAQLTSDNIAKGFAALDIIAEPSVGTLTIFGLLEARSAVTPNSGGIITPTIEALRD